MYRTCYIENVTNNFHWKLLLFVYFRFLATGESFRSLAFVYRLGAATVSNIVSDVCMVLWSKLSPVYMKQPQNAQEWLQIAAEFQERWDFPHCVGAIDGKHVVIKCPAETGSLHFNYKGTFSTVLMALVGANYKFIAIDVGSYGRNSDGGIFANCNLGRALSKNTLHLPHDEVLPMVESLGPIPYVMVGDEAFPLQRQIMRPFPGRGCPEEDKYITTAYREREE